MSLSTSTLWFEVAVAATIIALGHCVLGHFEERTAKLRIRLDATGVSCGRLEWKDYPDSQIDFGDEELEQIIGDIESLHNLREIYFQVTKLSDRSVAFFVRMPGLQVLNLQVTDITMNGAQILRSRLPTTTVEHDTAVHPVRMKD